MARIMLRLGLIVKTFVSLDGRMDSNPFAKRPYYSYSYVTTSLSL